MILSLTIDAKNFKYNDLFGQKWIPGMDLNKGYRSEFY
jgi:hypothetical protein